MKLAPQRGKPYYIDGKAMEEAIGKCIVNILQHGLLKENCYLGVIRFGMSLYILCIEAKG